MIAPFRMKHPVPVVLAAVVLFLGGCLDEGGGPPSPSHLTIELSQEMLDLKAAVPGQTARLDIEGGPQNVPMTVLNDGTVTATVSNVPFGTRQFRITYFGTFGSTTYPLAEVTTSADIAQNSNVSFVNSPIETAKFDANGDNVSNLQTLLAQLDPGGNAAPAVALEVAEGGKHTCAVVAPVSGNANDPNTLRCWGDNSFDQLGTGTPNDFSRTPVPISDISDPISVASGATFSCALLRNKTVKCWGLVNGSLGDGSTTRSATPIQVANLTDADAIAAGFFHACALRATREIVCWGFNNLGQLGNNTQTDQPLPVTVVGINNAIAVRIGGGDGQANESTHTCAVLATGGLRCWGSNRNGQLGNNSQAVNSSTPVTVIGEFSGATAVAAGDAHTCLINSADQNLRCWGLNDSGQIGFALGTTQTRQPLNGSGGAIGSATSLAAGGKFTCASLTTGRVKCMGSNTEGELGNGTNNLSTIGLEVSGITTALRLGNGGGGRGHACVVLQSPVGGLRCWGRNDRGQLGDNSQASSSNVPVRPVGFN